MEGKAVIRICLWAGPRNVATALMYSFRQRPDTRVADEPLHAHYLRVSGDQEPGREQVLAAMEQDGGQVIRSIVLGPCDREVLFMKHIAPHLVEVQQDFLRHTTNVVLTSDPRRMLLALTAEGAQPGRRDASLALQSELVRQLRKMGQDPPVLDERELLHDPEGVLWTLCERIGIAFTPRMLRWPPGPKPEDGVWAGHCYAEVHHWTHFLPWREKKEPLPKRLEALLAECRPDYEFLSALAIKARR